MPGNNLPAQLTSLIGREREIGELRQMLARSRLVTLTGAPGCGKTRLALAVATDAREAFPDGTFIVELGPLADSGLVPQTIATTFGVREGPDRPLMAALHEHLRLKLLLLVLDNCEHLLDACANFLEASLRACPTLSVLATSRELLEVNGELAFRVPSLTYPPEGTDHTYEYEAPRLFVDRAQLTLPAFKPTAEDWQAIGAICRHLDGIPLAIELAAAKIDVLSPVRILDHLSDRFRLLSGGRRRPGGRPQTLRAAIDWSYLLLAPAEQKMFRRLAVFGGSFTLEAAAAVATADEVGRGDVLELVARLVKKSLVVAQSSDEQARYRLLETLSEYGREKLLAHGELSDVRNRHLQFFAEMAEAAFKEWRTEAHSSWLQRLVSDIENLRLALDWARSQDRSASVRLSGALAWFWWTSGRLLEGGKRLEESLQPPEGTDFDRARALDGACMIAYHHSDFLALETFAAEQVIVCERLGDRCGLASAVTALAEVALFKDHDAKAAEALLMKSLELSTTGGFLTQESEALTILGLIGFWRDDLESVPQPWERALRLSEQVSDVPQRIRMLADMTCLNLIRGRIIDAARSAAAALAAYRATPGHHSLEEMLLQCYAWLAVEAGDIERALQLEGASRASSRLSGYGEPPTWSRYWNPVLRKAMATVPAEVVERALSEGVQLDIEQAFALAEALARPAPIADRRYVEIAGVKLTRRELEVAVMVAKGMSNRQIAARLVLTERTVEGHVENLLSKLHFHSRAAVAAWVVAQNELAVERPP